jgi:hypothetical protein
MLSAPKIFEDRLQNRVIFFLASCGAITPVAKKKNVVHLAAGEAGVGLLTSPPEYSGTPLTPIYHSTQTRREAR